LRWAEDREHYLLQRGRELPTEKKEVPTLEEFAPRFMDGHARANRQKPSGIAAKETILNVHLVPLLGSKKLDAITTEQVQQLKHRLSDKAPKTVNNVLTVLNVVLKKAVEWEVIGSMLCAIRLLRVPKPSAGFYDFDEYSRLVDATDGDPQARVVVLLGGEAGLRCGEIMALQWTDIDLDKRQLCVARSEWKGHVTVPKGGRSRYVPLTRRLGDTLRTARHLRGPRVVCDRQGRPITQKVIQGMMRRVARRANVKAGVHILRHTFCSHLAMRGAPARAIQELAGHEDLTTTQRYMHLSPAALDNAVRLLDNPGVPRSRGDIVETRSIETPNSFR
jgi:integrase